MLVVEEEQKFFLWWNYTKYNLIHFGVMQCQIFFPSYLFLLLFLSYTVWLHYKNSLHLKCFSSKEKLPPQRSNPTCVVKYNFVIFINHILCTYFTACCFSNGGVEWDLYFTVLQCVSWLLANDFTSQLLTAVVKVFCDTLLQYLLL